MTTEPDGWLTIETVPKATVPKNKIPPGYHNEVYCGPTVLLTDGIHFAAGCHTIMVESAEHFRGYVNGGITESFTDIVPNPKAGKRTESWYIYGCSAFVYGTEVSDDDGPLSFKPTHWMLSLPPPTPGERL
jgi:hypothetical protein